jgi:type I restriction enzyme S subunit
MKLPKGWKVAALEEVAEIQTGLSKSERREGPFVRMPYLRVANVQDGRFDLSEIKEIDVPEGMVERFRVRSGDVLLTEGGDFDKLGRGSVWRGQIKDCVHQNHIFVIRPQPKKLDTRFFAYQTQSPHGRAYFLSCSKQSTNLASVNSTQLRQFPALLPPLPEQRKIADILCTWDEALEKLDALIAAKDRRKKGLMQQLLTGKRRVKGFVGKWKRTTFGDLLHESRNPGSHGLIAHKITVKLYGKGVYAKQERMVGSPNTKYFVRHTGQFIYSKLDFLNGAFGIVPPFLDGFESTQDLPAFDVAKKCDVRWLLAYVARPEFYTHQLGAAAGGRKARRVNPPEFLALPVSLPDLPEQRAIADILDACDEELRLLRDQRAAIDRQKRGLMQRLLTGTIRLNKKKCKHE